MRADSHQLLEKAKQRIDAVELRVHRVLFRALLPVADLLTEAKLLYELETGTGHGKRNPQGFRAFVDVAAEALERSPSFVDRQLRIAQLDPETRTLLGDLPKLASSQTALLALCREPELDRRRSALEAFKRGGSRAFKKALERPLIEPVDVAAVDGERVREVMAAYQTARGEDVDQASEETGAFGQAEPAAAQLDTRVDACDRVHDDPLEFLKTFGDGWGSPIPTDPGPLHQHESESPAKRARRDRALAVFEYLQGGETRLDDRALEQLGLTRKACRQASRDLLHSQMVQTTPVEDSYEVIEDRDATHLVLEPPRRALRFTLGPHQEVTHKIPAGTYRISATVVGGTATITIQAV